MLRYFGVISMRGGGEEGYGMINITKKNLLLLRKITDSRKHLSIKILSKQQMRSTND